jgi:hypothetical protein
MRKFGICPSFKEHFLSPRANPTSLYDILASPPTPGAGSCTRPPGAARGPPRSRTRNISRARQPTAPRLACLGTQGVEVAAVERVARGEVATQRRVRPVAPRRWAPARLATHSQVRPASRGVLEVEDGVLKHLRGLLWIPLCRQCLSCDPTLVQPEPESHHSKADPRQKQDWVLKSLRGG